MHLQQPPDSKTCGHHCVAMLCGVSVEEVFPLVGHWKGTNRKQLAEVALCFGKYIEDTSTGTLPEDGDLLIRVKSRAQVHPYVDHFMCRVGGAYHDPSWHEPWDRIYIHPNYIWRFWKVY